MKLYRLSVSADESQGEGEDWDEWFTSKAAAIARRRVLIAENPTGENIGTASDFAIHRIEIDDAGRTRKQLACWLLNGRKYIAGNVQVVPPYEFDRKQEMENLRARLAEGELNSFPVELPDVMKTDL